MAHETIEFRGKQQLIRVGDIELIFRGLISAVKEKKYTGYIDAVSEWELGLKYSHAGLVNADHMLLDPYFSGDEGGDELLSLVDDAIDLLGDTDQILVEDLNRLYGIDIGTDDGYISKKEVLGCFDWLKMLVVKGSDS